MHLEIKQRQSGTYAVQVSRNGCSHFDVGIVFLLTITGAVVSCRACHHLAPEVARKAQDGDREEAMKRGQNMIIVLPATEGLRS